MGGLLIGGGLRICWSPPPLPPPPPPPPPPPRSSYAYEVYASTYTDRAFIVHCIESLECANNDCKMESLCSDFQGKQADLRFPCSHMPTRMYHGFSDVLHVISKHTVKLSGKFKGKIPCSFTVIFTGVCL